jgi:adenylate cyclase
MGQEERTTSEEEERIEAVWRRLFEEGEPELIAQQEEYKKYPSPYRCKLCFVPFSEEGARRFGKVPSQRNPYFCNACDAYIKAYPGRGKVRLSIVFVDARDSVGLAERMDDNVFGKLMNNFFYAATLPLMDTEGFVIEFIGDAVAGVYPPAFCGDYSSKAIKGAERLIRAKMPFLPDGGELPIGVGVHTGTASMGTVQSALQAYQDVQPFGDSVNVASRLSSMAAPGQALISEETLIAAGVPLTDLHIQEFKLRGRKAPVRACAIDLHSDPLPTRLART